MLRTDSSHSTPGGLFDPPTAKVSVIVIEEFAGTVMPLQVIVPALFAQAALFELAYVRLVES